MNTRNRTESVHELSNTQEWLITGGIAAGVLAVGVLVGNYALHSYIDHTFHPGKNVGHDLGITNGSAEFSQQLDKGVVDLQIPRIDIEHQGGGRDD